MNYKQAQAELKGYPKLVVRSARLLEQEKELESKVSSAKVQEITDMPVCHGEKTDLSDYMVTLESIRYRRQETIRKIAEIENRISLVEDDELSEILRLRYKKCLNWAEVGMEMDKSTSWASHRNGKAIRAYMVEKEIMR